MVRINKDLLAFVSRLYETESFNHFFLENYSPKQSLIKQGKKVFSVFIIKSGIAKCYLSEDNGKDFIQEFFSDGEIFGEIETINEHLSFCSIEAITDLQVFEIKGDKFHKLLRSNSKFNELILKAFANKVKYKAIRHGYNQSHTIEDKLLRLMNEFPELLQHISKQDIANYLGVTARSLNRTLSDMGKKFDLM
ncbi:Crp/Fnr family transcriptional regulator [Fulvivirga sp. 29W222]|uniref:Crp/Fnr family transcriptional regulator n=1 Tax=Fulvivirga marina TaxID=2494733 RepID=A0A937FYV4_9BACT|nr:Crp/Fnr family transcriptional regulator [Fulvivirga marina]MBL6447342.1 Crp/Fnr family transcriptional regulator [Fulvivirga marina]